MAGYEDFVDLSHRPRTDELLVSARIKVPSWTTYKRAAGAVAAESSVGTWSQAKHLGEKHVQRVAARVYSMSPDGWIRIAYPQDHFEWGNMGQILASIAGNVFGMKTVDSLRLEDIQWPRSIVRSFPGPQFGIRGVRKILGVPKRPIMLSVPKPKVGMTTEEHARIGYEIWTGGLDLLKDDENLTSQKFNPFDKRARVSFKMRDLAERETGEKKSYLINISGPSTEEMLRRAKLVADLGGEYVMIDIITCGWTALRSLREFCEDHHLAIHAHRAFHAAFTRNLHHGFSMLATAQIARLLGCDQLHIGTGIGKLVSPLSEVLAIRDRIVQDVVTEDRKTHHFAQHWHGMTNMFPVSSGGLHPGLIPQILKIFGTDVMLQIGGGIHGHPDGSYAGAKAMRAAVEGTLEGKKLPEIARSSPEFAAALKLWGTSRPR